MASAQTGKHLTTLVDITINPAIEGPEADLHLAKSIVIVGIFYTVDPVDSGYV